MNNLFSKKSQGRPTSQERQKVGSKDAKQQNPPPVLLRAPLKEPSKPTQPAAVAASSRAKHNIPASLDAGADKKRTQNAEHPSPGSKRRKSQSTIEKIVKLDYDARDFKNTQQQFFELVSKHFKVMCYKLEPTTEEGNNMMTDGSFWSCWGKVLKRNPYVNTFSLFTDICKSHYGKLTTGKAVFQSFMLENSIDPKQYVNHPTGAIESPKKQSVGKKQGGELRVPGPKQEQQQRTKGLAEIKAVEPEGALQQKETRSASAKKKTHEHLGNNPSPNRLIVEVKPVLPSAPNNLTLADKVEKVETIAAERNSPKVKSFVERMREAKHNKPEQAPLTYPMRNKSPANESNEEQKKRMVSASDNFVIDFFEINDLYLPRELLVTAVLENNYRDLGLYAVMLAKKAADKDNASAEEFLVISSLQDTASHKPETLKEIEQKYEIQGFLVREEGTELNKLWMKGLADK